MQVIVATGIIRVRRGQGTAEAGTNAARHKGFEGKLGGNASRQGPCCQPCLHGERAAGIKQARAQPVCRGRQLEGPGDNALVSPAPVVLSLIHL